MTTATTSVRDAILARCDELERLAQAAVTHWGGVVHPNHATLSRDERSHVATWEPAAVLALVAGAREMCEIHQPADDPGYHEPGCRGCGMDRTGEWMERIGDCPTLAALARMLGVESA